jgi:hypothetical protein
MYAHLSIAIRVEAARVCRVVRDFRVIPARTRWLLFHILKLPSASLSAMLTLFSRQRDPDVNEAEHWRQAVKNGVDAVTSLFS